MTDQWKESRAALVVSHPGHELRAYPFAETPFYERHGEKQVAEGYYDQVIRYREHMLALAEGLWSQV